MSNHFTFVPAYPYLCNNDADQGPIVTIDHSISSKGIRQMNKDIKESEDGTSIQTPEQISKRSYSHYAENNILDFDPMKELNLPHSYDEVLARFNNLQADRGMEGLN